MKKILTILIYGVGRHSLDIIKIPLHDLEKVVDKSMQNDRHVETRSLRAFFFSPHLAICIIEHTFINTVGTGRTRAACKRDTKLHLEYTAVRVAAIRVHLSHANTLDAYISLHRLSRPAV